MTEKVEVPMPTRKVDEMSRSTPPPPTKSVRAARKVVLAVMMVRAKPFRAGGC